MFEVSCHTSICAQYRSRYSFVKARQLYQGNRGRPAACDVSGIPTRSDRLHVHEIVLKEARAMSRVAAEAGDDGTNDVIVNDVVRRFELQVSFVAGHLVNAPRAGGVAWLCSGRVDRPTRLIEPVARRPSSA
jgi:hypothetical protein